MKKLITLSLFVVLYHIGFSQTWTQKAATFAGSGGRGTTAFSIPSLGKGYVVGCAPGDYQTWAYDTLSASWTQEQNFSGGADGTQVGFSINGIGYLGSGVATGCLYFNQFYKYDPIANQWTQLLNVPGPNRGYATGFAVGGKGYIGCGISGCYGTVGFHDFYSYDPTTNKWDTIAPCPANGSLQMIGFSIGSYGYVGTGDSLNGTSQVPQQDFWRYDPSNNTWTRMADFPGGARGGASAFATCNKGYIGLGYSDVNQSILHNDFYQYDPDKNQWSQIANFGGVSRFVAPSFTVGHACFVTLGVSATNATQSDIWEYVETVMPAFTTANGSTTTICAGQSVSFTDTSSYSPTNWSWSFPGGTPSSSTIQNPVIQYNTAGTFNVTLSAWNGCDSASVTLSQYVTVGSGDTLTVTANPSFVCSGQPSTLTITSGSGAYQWSPSTGLTDSTSANITANPTITTTYTVTQAGGGNCASTGHVVVTVGNNTIAGTVGTTRDTICQGTPGNLTLGGNSSNTIQWQSSTDDITYTDISGATSTDYRTPPLQQSTWYHAVVSNGNCSDTSNNFLLYVPPALTANFNASQGATGQQFMYNSDSSIGNIRSYHWDFGDGTTSTDSNPTHTFVTDTSVYYVCLTLYDGSNCSYTFCRYIFPVGIPTISAGSNWIVYPNPFSEELTISSKQNVSRVQSINVYDVLGQLVVNKTFSNTTNTSLHLDVSSLAKGMYYVMIKTADADYVQKVVKQ